MPHARELGKKTENMASLSVPVHNNDGNYTVRQRIPCPQGGTHLGDSGTVQDLRCCAGLASRILVTAGVAAILQANSKPLGYDTSPRILRESLPLFFAGGRPWSNCCDTDN